MSGLELVLTSLLRPDECSVLGSTCNLLDLQVGPSLNTYIMATHASTGLHLSIVYLEENQYGFEPVRVKEVDMDPVGKRVVNLLLKAHQLRHLIMRDIKELDWILVVAELWPLFAQLHTLELGCSRRFFSGSRNKVECGRLADNIPLYRAASRLRETIRLRWLSVGQRDLLQDDIKQLADDSELAAAKAILEDDYVSSAVCAAWNQSNDKGPPVPPMHPMAQRYRAYIQDCEDTGGYCWYDGFFDKVNDEWEALAASAIRENN